MRTSETWEGFLPEKAILMRRPAALASVEPAQPSIESSLFEIVATGNPAARVVFLGRSAGAHRSSVPFAGLEAELLDKMIAAMGLSRQHDVWVCCFESIPVGPLALAQLGASQPALVVTLGDEATQAILQTRDSISTMRGQFHEWNGLTILPTLHPAYLLLNPAAKREAWADLQLAMKFLATS